MADAPSAPSGPDLAAGIALTDLAEGAMLAGHVGDDAVLVARVGDEVLAIGATCTHYSGPLAEGLMVGDTVRCPWHHACFSLRTGDAVRAPALNPVACYEVHREGDRVRVGKKLERDPLAPVSPIAPSSDTPRAVVIVGAGAAGAAAAEMLRREGYAGAITLIDQEEASPYDRPNLSKDFLAGNAPEEWIPLRPQGFYAEHGIDVVRARVERIDVRERLVHLADGSTCPFDRLLLATGAEPVRLPMPGMDRPHVHVLRSLADSRAIIARARESKRAVVIGASFIGLEAAASLRARGLEVDVVAPEEVPLGRVMGERLGDFIRRLHEEHGVRFHLGHTARELGADAVTLDDGTVLTADLVVVGVGVRPRLALAEAAGLALDRGVAVNEYLETSAPGVYAAGDIARWPDPHTGERIRVEHWVVAERMGQTAARNMLGKRERFDAVPFFWSQHYDVPVAYVGHAERWDHLDVDGDADARDVAVRFDRGEQTLAVATIYRDRESLASEVAMEANRSGRRD